MIVQSSRLLQPLGMLRQVPLRAKMQGMQIQAQWCPGKWMEKQQMSDIRCEDFNELHRSRIVHSQMNLLFILRERGNSCTKGNNPGKILIFRTPSKFAWPELRARV
jgi:hypothetical protein